MLATLQQRSVIPGIGLEDRRSRDIVVDTLLHDPPAHFLPARATRDDRLHLIRVSRNFGERGTIFLNADLRHVGTKFGIRHQTAGDDIGVVICPGQR